MSKNMQRNIIILFGIIIIAALIFPDAAHAGTAGGGLPYEGFLNKLRSSLTGPVAFTLSIVGIVVAGGTLIFGGDISGFFKTVISLVLVISILVGANSFLTSFFSPEGAVIGQAMPPTVLALS
jgi:type IV secretion system protein VirB2